MGNRLTNAFVFIGSLLIVGCTSTAAWRYDPAATACPVHHTGLKSIVWKSGGWTLEPLPDDYEEVGRLEFPYSASFVDRHLRDMSEGDKFVVCDECRKVEQFWWVRWDEERSRN